MIGILESGRGWCESFGVGGVRGSILRLLGMECIWAHTQYWSYIPYANNGAKDGQGQAVAACGAAEADLVLLLH